MTPGMTRRAVTLPEVLLAVMLVGSMIGPFLMLFARDLRGTAMSEAELAARAFGHDVLERVAGRPLFADRGLSELTKKMIDAPARWRTAIDEDPALAHGFPKGLLAPLLDRADVRVRLEVVAPFEHPALGGSRAMNVYRVTVSWTDADDRRRSATYARLADVR